MSSITNTRFNTLATALSQKVIEEFNITEQTECMDNVVREFINNMEVVKTKSLEKNICIARIWGKSGSGNEQCKSKKKEGDYCMKHYKQAAVSEQPCVRDDNGNKVGLFFGRIDQFQEGLEVPPYKDNHNTIQIIWKNGEVERCIKTDFTNGYKHFKMSDYKKKKTIVEDTPAAVVEDTVAVAEDTPAAVVEDTVAVAEDTPAAVVEDTVAVVEDTAAAVVEDTPVVVV